MRQSQKQKQAAKVAAGNRLASARATSTQAVQLAQAQQHYLQAATDARQQRRAANIGRDTTYTSPLVRGINALLSAYPNSTTRPDVYQAHTRILAANWSFIQREYHTRAKAETRSWRASVKQKQFDKLLHQFAPSKNHLLVIGAGYAGPGRVRAGSKNSGLGRAFHRFIIQRRRVLYVDEFLSSQRCGLCHGVVTHPVHEMSVCLRCGFKCHRDEMAALCLFDVGLSQLVHGCRPLYLTPPISHPSLHWFHGGSSRLKKPPDL